MLSILSNSTYWEETCVPQQASLEIITKKYDRVRLNGGRVEQKYWIVNFLLLVVSQVARNIWRYFSIHRWSKKFNSTIHCFDPSHTWSPRIHFNLTIGDIRVQCGCDYGLENFFVFWVVITFTTHQTSLTQKTGWKEHLSKLIFHFLNLSKSCETEKVLEAESIVGFLSVPLFYCIYYSQMITIRTSCKVILDLVDFFFLSLEHQIKLIKYF